MRFLVPSLIACSLAIGIAVAQTGSGGGTTPQLPVGQVFQGFYFPYYQKGQLTASLAAREAIGKTMNRAEAIDLKIELYENGKATTTITSPKADLYMNDRKMRSKQTVLIERSDLEATAQTCDFDLLSKKYTLRQNVKVVLKNLDISPTQAKPAAAAPADVAPPSSDSSTNASGVPPLSFSPNPAATNISPVNSSGTYGNTNAAPIAPPPVIP